MDVGEYQGLSIDGTKEQTMKRSKNDNEMLEWEIRIPIFKNTILWFQLALVSAIGALFVSILLIGLNLWEKQWEMIPSSLIVGLSLFLGLFLLFALATLILFHSGELMRYRIDERGITQEIHVPRRKAFKWLGLLGLFSGSSAGSTAAGAALLADARNRVIVRWSENVTVEAYSQKGEVALSNGWRTIMRIHCPQGQYDEIMDILRRRLSSDTQKREIHTPLAKIVHTFVVTLFGILLLAELPIRVVPLFTVITVLLLLVSLWTTGKWRMGLAGAALFVVLAEMVTSMVFGGIELHRLGAIYAVIFELLAYGYFVYLSIVNMKGKGL